MPVEGHTESAAVATAPDLTVPPPEDADSSFESRLIASSGGEKEGMAEGKAALGSGTLRLAAFAAGRHFRGMLDGEPVVHGHRAALESGGCGILLDGEGVVRILSMKIIPAVE